MFICPNTEGVHAYLSKRWRGICSSVGMLKGYLVKERLGTPALEKSINHSASKEIIKKGVKQTMKELKKVQHLHRGHVKQYEYTIHKRVKTLQGFYETPPSNFTPQVKEARDQSQIFNRKSISRSTTHRQSYHLQAMPTGVKRRKANTSSEKVNSLKTAMKKLRRPNRDK